MTDLHRPYLTVQEAAKRLRCKEEDIWNALEAGLLGATMLAEFDSRHGSGYDCVSLPPEVIRRIRGKAHDEIEWERSYGLGKARIRVDPTQVRVLTHFVDAVDEPTSKKISQRQENAQLNIIGALLKVICLGIPDPEKPGAKIGPVKGLTKDGKLKAAIAAHYQGFDGLSLSNLEHTFPAAKRSVEAG